MDVSLNFQVNESSSEITRFYPSFSPLAIDDFLDSLRNSNGFEKRKIYDELTSHKDYHKVYHIEPYGITMTYCSVQGDDYLYVGVHLYGDKAEKLKEFLLQKAQNYSFKSRQRELETILK